MARHGQQNIKHPVILALELSTMWGSISLVCPNLCIYEQSLYSTKTHSKRLISQIDAAILQSGFSWPEIDAIAVSLGPGSFTGLRIALGTVKGLAMAFEKKVIGIATLDGLAFQIPLTKKQICPMLDARKQEVYSALYRYDQSGLLNRIGECRVLSAENLADNINEPTIFLGDGSTAYKDFLRDRLADFAVFCPPELFYPRAASIAKLALQKYYASDFLDPASATPLYVRASDAELNFGR